MLKLFFVLSIFSFQTLAQDLETVAEVDLKQYMGIWYEVAAIPQEFQKDCIRNTQAKYSLLENGMVEVINSCELENGKIKKAEGRARVEDKETRAKLKVTFVKLFDWIFRFGGDYWIIDLAPDYSYAVVGHPKRTYGWILSRTPQLPKATLEKISDVLKSKGYDLCLFYTTPQGTDSASRDRLCDIVNGN